MFRELFSFLAPSLARRAGRRPKRKAQGAQRVSDGNFAPAGGEASGEPKVLLANLNGDSGGVVTAQLSEVLDSCDALEVYRANQVLKLPKDANLVRRLMLASEKGREWLREQQADILVWGEVEGNSVRLRFDPKIPCADNLPGAFGLGDTLQLPTEMLEAQASVVHATVLAAVGPTFPGLKTHISEVLGWAVQGARDITQNQPEGMSAIQHATVLISLANAFSAQYRLIKGAKNLASAASLYQTAVKKTAPEADPDIWAVAQSHLATALKARGIAERDDDGLKQSAVAYKKITETLGRGSHPYDWALAHINHGLVLYRLSMRTGRAAYLQEAGKSFEEALTVYTKETMPTRWAEVMNQYGTILLALGEQVTGNVTLEMAVAKFRKVLEVRKRDRAPQLWAQTANNLGAACFSLAKRNAEVALLREAQTCFEGAAETYQRLGDRKRAEVIRSNSARVERLLTARAGQSK
jgi:hypothetical protein